jgi:Asp-tRNA(Asn)/Glu-tRNA(Gln) amidotransferase C subunit
MSRIKKIVEAIKKAPENVKTAFNPITKTRDMRQDAIEEGCHSAHLLGEPSNGN